MIPLFLGLTAVNLLMLGATAWLGFAYAARTPLGDFHVLCGAMSAIVCCAVHCIVFTYFIATAKWIQHAVEVKKLDPALTAPTRSFKMQAFPAALLAMASVFVAAVFGALVANYGVAAMWHLLASMSAIGVNVLVAVVEFFAISKNGRLVDSVLESIHRADGSTAPATII